MEEVPKNPRPRVSLGPVRAAWYDIDQASEAACLGNPDPFYGAHVDLRLEQEDDRLAREAYAAEICQGCVIQWPCLEWSLKYEEEFGIWGGSPYRERSRFIKWLKKTGWKYEDGSVIIPQGSTLKNELGKFRIHDEKERRKRQRAYQARKKAKAEAKRKRAQPKAKIVSITQGRRNGSRPKLDGVRTNRGSSRSSSMQASAKSAVSNSARSGRQSGSSQKVRAATVRNLPGRR